MKRTNTKEFRAKVKAYLLPIIADKAAGYGVELPENPFQWVIDIAESEVPHEFERGGKQRGLHYWLSGLGMNVACYNGEIVELSEQWHECTLKERERDKVVGQWFDFLAVKIMQFAGESGNKTGGAS